ncbi:MAG: RlmE family RNA methyltransferase [Candidatus Spechtbacteria bacterium]|nr:RlmE family RNA methyltransferase [Candidatus Spechtbacteria bacterium]
MYRKDNKKEFYTTKAQEEGFVARSIYKLKEIDKKYEIFHKGDRVIDFGATPGSWMQYISEKVGSRGLVWGIDITDLKAEVGTNMKFEKLDILTLGAEHFGEEKFNVVVSDMAPLTSGIHSRDTGISYELSSKALEIATGVLIPGGHFVTKIFEGEYTRDFQQQAKQYFSLVKPYRPEAVKRDSREEYIVCKNFNPNGVTK